MIEFELLALVILVGVIVLVCVYAWLSHSKKFDQIVKHLEPSHLESAREAAARREVEERRKQIEAERKKKYV